MKRQRECTHHNCNGFTAAKGVSFIKLKLLAYLLLLLYLRAMKKITVNFRGKDFNFTYYSTTLNTENIYFVQTNDKHAARLLVEDHFFITVDIRDPRLIYFNAIKAEEREASFKEEIARAIVLRYVNPELASFTNN